MQGREGTVKPASAPFDIPYRLESLEDISRAIRTDFLNIGARYREMYAVARKVGRLHVPPALAGSRRRVRKEFFRVDEEVMCELDVEYVEIANLSLVDGFAGIEERVPQAVRLAGCDDLLAAVRTFPAPVREACRVPCEGRGGFDLLGALDAMTAIRELLAAEILACVRTGRPKRVGMDDLKGLLVACTLFRPGNEDVREAIRRSGGPDGAASVLFQNAVAELLFRRLPRHVGALTRIEPNMVRRKFLSRVAKIGLRANQKTNLFGYFAPNLPQRELLPTLDKIESVAENLRLSEETRGRLRDFIGSLRREIAAVRGLYEEWFLTPELRRMRRLHRPRDLMTPRIPDWNRIVRTVTRLTTLDFYPTKDWMDFCKARASSDCSGSRLGERHLRADEFFNIRIFQGEEWIGNIYMLDFTREAGCLLVDRIQIPRKIPAEFIQFFDHLGEVFGELFEEVDYEEILMPLRISNHAAVQKAFNEYRAGLEKRSVRLRTRRDGGFESVAQRKPYSVLLRKPRRAGREPDGPKKRGRSDRPESVPSPC
jgi:hypothetical protein